MLARAAALVFGLCLPTTPALAMSIELYQQLADAPEARHSGLIVRNIYLRSLYEMLLYVIVLQEQRGQRPLFCPPEHGSRLSDAALDALMRARFVRQTAYHSPAERLKIARETPAELVLIEVLQEEFPCR